MLDVKYDPTDILAGASAIAEYLGPPWNKRKVYHAAERQNLPIGRNGATLTASKRRLAEHFEKVTSGGAAA